jgi:hypothetical protein
MRFSQPTSNGWRTARASSSPRQLGWTAEGTADVSRLPGDFEPSPLGSRNDLIAVAPMADVCRRASHRACRCRVPHGSHLTRTGQAADGHPVDVA